MEIISRGAEAILYKGELYGDEVLIKERIKKNYRIGKIDKKLRKERTKRETKLMRDARSVGVNTPKVLETDYDDYRIIMEFIDGEKVKDVLEEAKDVEDICRKIGSMIGKLHGGDIIHGDLTTSNMIVENDSGKIFFIDFGLGSTSKRIEDKGVDLKLMRDSLKSTHYNILKLCWASILEGYKEEYNKAEEIIKKIDEIERRARYAEHKKPVKK